MIAIRTQSMAQDECVTWPQPKTRRRLLRTTPSSKIGWRHPQHFWEIPRSTNTARCFLRNSFCTRFIPSLCAIFSVLFHITWNCAQVTFLFYIQGRFCKEKCWPAWLSFLNPILTWEICNLSHNQNMEFFKFLFFKTLRYVYEFD